MFQDGDERNRTRKPRFSPHIGLGDVLTMLTVVVTVLSPWYNREARVERLEEIAVKQERTNGELKSSIKETHLELRNDIKEVAATVRRIEVGEVSRGRGG